MTDVIEGEVLRIVEPDPTPTQALAVAAPPKESRRALVPVDPEGQPWDRMKGERGEWFVRFEAYRSLDPARRKVRAVYLAECTRIGITPKGITPQSWLTHAREWRWIERATAYDDHEIAANRRSEVNAREAARDLRVKALLKPLAKIAQAIDRLPQDEITWNHATQGTAKLVEQLRKEQGLPEDVPGGEKRESARIKVLVGVDMERV